MDIIRFTNPNLPPRMEQGIIVNDLKSKLWIERYRDAGEFAFVAPVSSGIRQSLPIGSFVTHVNSNEIMIVENHEIIEDQGSESDITVSGRSFETFLENRVVNSEFSLASSHTDPPEPYVLPEGTAISQVADLIDQHTRFGALMHVEDYIPYIRLAVSVGIDPLINLTTRIVQNGNLYERVLEILKLGDIGIKTVRPRIGSGYPVLTDSYRIYMYIYTGYDLSSNVVFTHDSGEIENADYLWSNKNLKNAAMISGKIVETLVLPAQTGYDRRMMYIDGSDLEGDYSVDSTEEEKLVLVAAMEQRAIEILRAQKGLVLTKAQISKDATSYTYREDYNIGDIVAVRGNYNEDDIMRVSEYVEIEDETGESGYPTLTTI